MLIARFKPDSDRGDPTASIGSRLTSAKFNPPDFDANMERLDAEARNFRAQTLRFHFYAQPFARPSKRVNGLSCWRNSDAVGRASGCRARAS